MDVTVRLFASLREHAGAGTLALELGDGATVADAIAELRSGALAGLPENAPFVAAVAREYVERDHPLSEGDELALVPPVSGGAGPSVGSDRVRLAEITGEPLDVEAVRRLVADPSTGATVVFCGTTREVPSLEYEAYVEMAEEKIRELAEAVVAEHGLAAIACAHRTGTVELMEPSIVHRRVGGAPGGGVRGGAGVAGRREVAGAGVEEGASGGRASGVGGGDVASGLRSGWRQRSGWCTYAMLRYMRPAILAALIALLALAGCGSSDDDGGELLVSAATSLKSAFTNYGAQFDAADAQFSFAGSDELAAQIRTGAKPDVFASANTKLPDQLFAEGLVERPQVFASNRLVLAVAADGAKVRGLEDLEGKGVTIAIGSAGVPIGAYTRKVLGRLDAAARKAILANVRSEEPDVGGISAKLGQGAADAGFLYVTDVAATNGRLMAIELPAKLQPTVAYGVAIVKGAANRKAAQAFVAGLRGGAGQSALKAAGFRAAARVATVTP